MGGEISIVGHGDLWGLPTSILAGYTFIEPRYQDFDSIAQKSSSVDYNVLKYRNKHSVKLDFNTQYKMISMGWAVQYNSFMEAVDAVFEELLPGVGAYREANNKGETLVNLRVGFHINDNITVTALVKNLFNNEYQVRPALLEAPRSYTLKYSHNF